MITRDGFLAALKSAIPESAGIVGEHLYDHDELLLHLLMSDLLRMTIDAFQAGQVEVTDRLLLFIDGCLRDGDGDIVNAVMVSFVEDFGAYPGESDALLDRWPSALRAQLGR